MVDTLIRAAIAITLVVFVLVFSDRLGQPRKTPADVSKSDDAEEGVDARPPSEQDDA